MNPNIKKALLIFGGGIILFWAFKKIRPLGGRSVKSKDTSSNIEPTESQKRDAIVVLKAYSEAKKAGENKTFLDEMNGEFAKEYKLRVYTDKGSGKLFAADLDGNKII
jgi:hypothetical protein